MLADKEETECQGNISSSANSMRDGVFLSHQTRQKPLVMATELSQLKGLEAYIRLPGNYPCTQLQLSYQKGAALRKEPFLLKPEKKRRYEAPQETKSEMKSDLVTQGQTPTPAASAISEKEEWV